MCMLMLKLPEGHVTRKNLYKAWKHNPDGAGFAWNTEGKVYIRKGFFKFREFYRALRKAERENPASVFMVHLRLATSGKKVAEACHPFQINKELAMGHNGIFSGLGNEKYSDTQEFAAFLRKLPRNFMHDKTAMKILSTYVKAETSKIVLLDGNGSWKILGEEKGYWENGVWYSNYQLAWEGFKRLPVLRNNWEDSWGNDEWTECFSCGSYLPCDDMTEVKDGHYLCDECFRVYSDELIPF